MEGKLPLAMAFFLNFVIPTNIVALFLKYVVTHFSWGDIWYIKIAIVYSYTLFIIVYFFGVIGVASTLLKKEQEWYYFIVWSALALSAFRVYKFLV